MSITRKLLLIFTRVRLNELQIIHSKLYFSYSDMSIVEACSTLGGYAALGGHDALHAIFIPTQTQLSRRSCCVATTLHRPRRYISFERIWLTPSKTISTTWLDTQSVTRPPRASPLGWTRSPSLGHLAHPYSTAPRGASPLCTSSPLGRPACRYSVVHVFTTWPLRASPLGCACLHHTAAPRVTTWLDT